MKFIYKFILGLFLFNAMLILVASLVPHATLQHGAVDINDSRYTNYSTMNLEHTLITIFIDNPWGLGIFLALSLLGVGGVLSGRNTPLFLGIAILIGFFIYMLTGTLNVVLSSVNDYPLVKILVNIILIVIGFVAILSVGDMLTSRSDVN